MLLEEARRALFRAETGLGLVKMASCRGPARASGVTSARRDLESEQGAYRPQFQFIWHFGLCEKILGCVEELRAQFLLGLFFKSLHRLFLAERLVFEVGGLAADSLVLVGPEIPAPPAS